MYHKYFLTFLFSLFLVVGYSQNTSILYTIIDYPVTLEMYSSLHKKINETSGLIFFDSDAWTFNDSGGKPELYRVNPSTGKISQKVVVENATNKDWEDIAQDEEFIYIGDMGNNAGNRKNLKIYKIRKDKIGDSKKEIVTADIINFSYADQETFEVKWRKNNYDCESVITFEDNLLLFSKNWIDGKTRMYKLSKEPGDYSLSPESDFEADGLITGADYNAKTKELVFIGYKNKKPFIFIFNEFDGKKLGAGDVTRINLPKLNKSQTEGICFIDENTILISTERTKIFDQSIYKLNIDEVFKHSGIEYD